MTILAYRCCTPVIWFLLTTLPYLLPEDRELFLISELHTIKNFFSLFRQRAANFQISTIWVNALHWHMQNNFCSSKNRIARQYCISLEKQNYNDVGTPLDFCPGNDIRITTLLPGRKNDVENRTLYQREFLILVTTLETQRCDNVVTTLSDVATKIQSKPNVVTTSCASWVCEIDTKTSFLVNFAFA